MRRILTSILLAVAPAALATVIPIRVVTSPINVSFVPVRQSGVAPLCVFFDASATTSPAVTSRPFHDLEYRFTFGDAGSGTWSQGSGAGVNSKNSQKGGPVAGHCYESAGSYSACLTVYDGTNTSPEQCTTVTVTDPNTVFSGTNTVCISADSLPVAGAGGCPASAAVAQQAALHTALSTYMGSGKRVLLNRDDAFTCVSTPIIAQGAATWILGAYGTGAAPVVTCSSGQGSLSVRGTDGRVMDITFDGNSAAGGISGSTGGDSQLTFLRVTLQNVSGSGFSWSEFTLLADQFAVQDSTVQTLVGGQGGNGGYIAATRFMWLGNSIDDTTAAEHGLRSQHIGRGIIANSTFSEQAASRALLTLRGLTWSGCANNRNNCGTGGYPSELYTEKVIVADNKFIPSADVTGYASAAPQNNTSDERLRNLIFERNWFTPPATGTTVAVVLVVTASDVTVRNNIFSLNGQSNDHRALSVIMTNTSSGYPVPNKVDAYNNSIYFSDTGTEFKAITFSDTATNPTVKNNAVYAPNTGNAPVMVSGSPTGLTQSNNSTGGAGGQIKLGPSPFIDSTPTAPADFASADYSTDGGAAVPVWSDFFGAARSGTYDLGAVNP